MDGKLINSRLFEEEFETFNGIVLIQNNTFIDNKMLDVLKESGYEFYIVELMKLSNK